MSKRKDQAGIDGENSTEQIALKVFFGEFVFSDLWFSHKDIGQGTNVELADLIVNIGNDLLAFQIKTRNGKPAADGDRNWIINQVKTAKRQLATTFDNLRVDGLPEFVNKKGDTVLLGKQGLFSGIIILKNEAIQDYKKILTSSKMGSIIHCFSYRDFEMCCDSLVMPKDILFYLFYRERYYAIDNLISEPEELCLNRFFIQKYGTADFNNNFIDPFKWFLNEYKNRLIDEGGDLNKYREIVQVLALFDRTEVDMFLNMFSKVREAARNRVYSDNIFMMPFDKERHSVLFLSEEEWNMQHAGKITLLFMYKSKVEKCITVVVCFEDSVNFRIDCILRECEWEYDSVIEELIADLGIQNKWIPKKVITGKR